MKRYLWTPRLSLTVKMHGRAIIFFFLFTHQSSKICRIILHITSVVVECFKILNELHTRGNFFNNLKVELQTKVKLNTTKPK